MGSIANFINGVAKQGGFSFSNNFDVEFVFGQAASELTGRFKNYGIDLSADPSSTGSLLKILCDEAQLPNVQAATGQITGRFLGEGLINYPHTKLYNDFQLSWMGDANLLALKFLNLWYGYIFQEYDYSSSDKKILPTSLANNSLSSVKTLIGSENYARSVRLNYPEKYLCNMAVTKTDRSKDAANGNAPISYVMMDAYPYSIDAVPMSYGASQIVKITANFYYSKHSVIYNNLDKSNKKK